MENELRAHLLMTAAAFAQARSLEMVTVGKNAAGDWRFFERLETGVGFTVRKYDAVMAWFSSHWPAEASWPVGVPRRSLTPA